MINDYLAILQAAGMISDLSQSESGRWNFQITNMPAWLWESLTLFVTIATLGPLLVISLGRFLMAFVSGFKLIYNLHRRVCNGLRMARGGRQ